MTDTRVALGSDRLPWLADEPIARRKIGGREPWIVGGAAVLLVAAAFYWLGVQSRHLEQVPSFGPPRPAVTTPLPEPQTLRPGEQVQIPPAPEVQPTPAPELRQTPAPVLRTAPERRATMPSTDESTTQTATTDETTEAQQTASSTEETSTNTAAAPAAPPPQALAPASALRLWPSRVTAGANGRVVQIGAFGSVHQAKLGWRRMARAYPGVKRLPAVVRPARNSKGRVFYRFQIGTTSQAHSEVLCQRMEKIDFSCAVVGLPWKPKGVER